MRRPFPTIAKPLHGIICKASVVISLAGAWAGESWAEGARIQMDCITHTTCKADGTCAKTNDAIKFVLSPVDVDASGAGKYTISYNGLEADATFAENLSFHWTSRDGVEHSITPMNDTDQVWVKRSILGSGTGRVDFQTCEVVF